MSVLNQIMCKSRIVQISSYRIPQNIVSSLCTNVSKKDETVTPKPSGYAKAFTKFETINEPPVETPQTFAALLRNSKFIDMGDPEGKIVIGKIFHIVEDDLYIDFGWKFHCVCPRPKRNSADFVRGAKVRLRIKDLELSSLFLGYTRDLTLLESDCHLLGIVQDRTSTNASIN